MGRCDPKRQHHRLACTPGDLQLNSTEQQARVTNADEAPSLTPHLSQFVADFKSGTIPDEVLEHATKAIVDTIGCTLAGSHADVAAPLLAYLQASGASGESRVIGHPGVTAPAEMAALVNGTFAHALDYDDVLSIMPAHPSAVVLPAMLACRSGIAGRSGLEFLQAYVVGIEVGARVGLAIGHGHYRRGWHATSTLSVFSAIGALAKIMQLDAHTTATAFGLGASMASGLQRNFGTMAKPLHAGLAARAAITAVNLARGGLTANLEVMDGQAGFLAVYGTDYSAASRGLRDENTPLAALNPGLSLKKYPCCYALHRQIEAALELREKLGLNGNNLAKMVCRVAPETMRPLRQELPNTGLEAKFSMPYTVAACICDGSIGLHSYTDEAVNNPNVREVMSRVECIVDPACVGDDGAAMSKSGGTIGFVELTATRSDKQTATTQRRAAPGSREQPLNWQEIESKFLDCAKEGKISPQSAAALFSKWRKLSSCGNIDKLLSVL